MDPALVESCYERALTTLRESNQSSARVKNVEKNVRAITALAQRALELAFAVSTESTGQKSVAHRIKDITDSLNSHGKVVPEVVQCILSDARKSWWYSS